jgi:copper chaperone NosL
MCADHPSLNRRRFLLASAASGLLAACGSGKESDRAAVTAREIDAGTSCSLDGMLLADYPGPKAQIHYAGVTQPDWFCDTVEMFSIFLRPEQARRIVALHVQDMGRADWEQPRGHWIDARMAIYVHGSKRLGSMGPTLASFATEADARTFAESHGGKTLRFGEVTLEMVALDGGALHDQRM